MRKCTSFSIPKCLNGFPPIAHAGNGPSGVTWLTGLSVPEDLRDSFLLTDYRGAATKCESWVIKLEPEGSGFKMLGIESLIQGLAASDVELGFDGNLYFADYGGGGRPIETVPYKFCVPPIARLSERG